MATIEPHIASLATSPSSAHKRQNHHRRAMAAVTSQPIETSKTGLFASILPPHALHPQLQAPAGISSSSTYAAGNQTDSVPFSFSPYINTAYSPAQRATSSVRSSNLTTSDGGVTKRSLSAAFSPNPMIPPGDDTSAYKRRVLGVNGHPSETAAASLLTHLGSSPKVSNRKAVPLDHELAQTFARSPVAPDVPLTPRTDTDAAQLMLYLATSPSPARRAASKLNPPMSIGPAPSTITLAHDSTDLGEWLQPSPASNAPANTNRSGGTHGNWPAATVRLSRLVHSL